MSENQIKISRSRIYPRYDLGAVILFLGLIDKLGGVKVAQKTILAEMGKNSSNDPVFSGKISSAKQLGLLEANKNTYSVTKSGKLLLYPTPETDKNKLLLEAFKTPNLFKELIQRFDGKELPKSQSLGNILYNEYGISKNAKNRAAKVFIKSAETVGAIVNGHLKATTGDEVNQIDKNRETVSPFNIFGRLSNNKNEPQEMLTIPIPLSDGNDIRIAIPRNPKDKEEIVNKITQVINAIYGLPGAKT